MKLFFTNEYTDAKTNLTDSIAAKNTVDLSFNRIIELRNRVMNAPENWSVKRMSNAVYLSVSSFTLKYKSIFGVSPGEDLKHFIIEKAKHLLENTNYTVREISDILNYSYPENLVRAFKNQTGMTPYKYRKHPSHK